MNRGTPRQQPSFALVGLVMETIRPPAVLPALTAQFQFDLELLLLVLALAGLVLGGGYVIARFKRGLAEQQQAAQPMRIEDYRALLEQGVLQPHEFERIRARLENKTPPTPAPPAASPPTDPTAVQSFPPPRPPESRPPETGIRDMDA